MRERERDRARASERGREGGRERVREGERFRLDLEIGSQRTGV